MQPFFSIVLTPAASVSPASFSGLQAWHRETAVLSGSDVTRWTDLSGLGCHLDASANFPTRTASNSAFNNFPTIDFAGTDNGTYDALIYVANPSLATSADMFMVVKSANSSTSKGAWTFNTSDSQGNAYPYSNGFMYLDVFATARQDSISPAVTITNAHLLHIRHDGTGSSNWTVVQNLATAVTATKTFDWSGATKQIGNTVPGNLRFTGSVAELIFYSPALSMANVSLLKNSYFHPRYGLF